MKEPYSPNSPLERGDLEIGLPEFIGPYKIDRFFEAGGMSLLFVGNIPNSNSPIIIKVLSKRFLDNPDAVKRFLAEADIIKLANHPNIVPLLDSGTWEGGLYIAMEYVKGRTLREVLKQKPLSLKSALDILLEIAYALCHLHTHHVIHRDLKPENILITEEGIVKVIDFGIAQMLYGNEKTDPVKKRFIGTPIYMSPEQKEKPESVSYPSDIYSLGIIAYELLIGKIILGQLHLSLLPKGLQKIIAKTLQKNPQDRYHDTVDLVSDISNYYHGSQFIKDETSTDKLIDASDALQNQSKLWLQPPITKKTDLNYKIKNHFVGSTISWNFLGNENQEVFLFLTPQKEGEKIDLNALLIFSAIKEALHQNVDNLPTVNQYWTFLENILSHWPGSPLLSCAIFIYLKKSQTLSFLVGGDLNVTFQNENYLNQKNFLTSSSKNPPSALSFPFSHKSFLELSNKSSNTKKGTVFLEISSI